MLKRLLPQGVWLTSLLAASLTLAACGGPTEPISQEPTAPAQTEEAVATSANNQEAEKPQEAAATTAATAEVAAATSEAEASPSENPAASTSPQAVCQAVDIPNNDLIASVSAEDWSKGPAEASITLIEYGDFQ